MTSRKAGDQLQVIQGNLEQGEEGLDSGEGLPELKISLGRDFTMPQKGANVARRKNVLGRGLSALLTSSAVPVDISNIPVSGLGGQAIVDRGPETSANEQTPPVETPATQAPQRAPQHAEAWEPEPLPSRPKPVAKAVAKPLPEGLITADDSPESPINTTSQDSPEGVLIYLSLDRIRANPDQPRRYFQPQELNELAETIRKTGLLQPIVVRRSGSESGQLAAYEIVAGERRFRAAKLAGLVKIPAILKQLNDREAFEIGIIENVQRANLNPIEEALAYQRLIDEFHCTQSEVAEKVGKDRASVANLLRLLKLAPAIQQMVTRGELSAGHGRALLMCETPEKQGELGKRIVAEGLSVREAEAIATGKNQQIAKLPNLGVSNTEVGPNRRTEGGPTPTVTKSPKILALESQLRRNLGTKVNLQLTKAGTGELRISFFSVEELEGLVERLEKK